MEMNKGCPKLNHAAAEQWTAEERHGREMQPNITRILAEFYVLFKALTTPLGLRSVLLIALKCFAVDEFELASQRAFLEEHKVRTQSVSYD